MLKQILNSSKIGFHNSTYLLVNHFVKVELLPNCNLLYPDMIYLFTQHVLLIYRQLVVHGSTLFTAPDFDCKLPWNLVEEDGNVTNIHVGA